MSNAPLGCRERSPKSSWLFAKLCALERGIHLFQKDIGLAKHDNLTPQSDNNDNSIFSYVNGVEGQLLVGEGRNPQIYKIMNIRIKHLIICNGIEQLEEHNINHKNDNFHLFSILL